MTGNRRDFFRATLASSTLVSLGAGTVPLFLGRSAAAARGTAGERILVVVQLLGGNDGLNTVVPHKLDGYGRGRRRLRLNPDQLLKVSDEIGLHAGLGGMARLLEGARLSIAQGVGYPNPDRSHFRSMEIWETARLESSAEALSTGWLGRVVDARPAPAGADQPAFHVGGGRLPLALLAKSTEPPSFESMDELRLRLPGTAAEQSAARVSLAGFAAEPGGGEDSLLSFARRGTLAAYGASQRLEEVAKEDGSAKYPEFGLSRRLSLIARIIKAGFGTRVFYTRLDGFDTHANQLASHAGLLTELGDSLWAFHEDLRMSGEADRVAVLVFSEFGRRVAENASSGTDHGAAAPVFVVGPVERAGLVGAHPSLEPEDLDDGDPRHHTDFRAVYADCLANWLGIDPVSIVGPGFEPAGILRPLG